MNDVKKEKQEIEGIRYRDTNFIKILWEKWSNQNIKREKSFTTTCSKVDGKAIVLLRKKREREWHDQIREMNDIIRPTSHTDHIQNNVNSTYLVLNKNSGRITLQQHTSHFHVTIHCSFMDGKLTKLLRGRNEKERGMISYEKTNDITRETRQIDHIQNNINSDQLINLLCSEQKQRKDHTPTTHEPLPNDHSLQQSGLEGNHPVTRKKRERERHDQIRETNDITRPTTQTDHIQNNISSGQLTLFWAETVEGSHSNKKRIISTWPIIAARWMGSLRCWNEKESDMIRYAKQMI